jgi:hypothetical protein
MLHTLENEALRAVGYWLLLSAAWYGAKFAAKARPVDGSTRLGGVVVMIAAVAGLAYVSGDLRAYTGQARALIAGVIGIASAGSAWRLPTRDVTVPISQQLSLWHQWRLVLVTLVLGTAALLALAIFDVLP